MDEITYTTGSLSPETDEAFEEELGRRRAQAGETPLRHLIGSDMVEVGRVFNRCDPSRSARVASSAYEAGVEGVERAIKAARSAAPAWRAISARERSAKLRAVADNVRSNTVEIAAVLSLETGKNRLEAIGEVQEGIALIETYCDFADDSNDWAVDLRTAARGDTNRSVLKPYGVFGVLTPFNFPFALFINMAVGALLTGNTVVAKPSEEAPWTGATVMDAMAGADLPRGVFNAIHGGEETGKAIVESDVDGLAFTGSVDVGRTIIQQFQSGTFTRPVISEMGGKNPVIVTQYADIDAAAEGVARAAFGMSGQKCSATSRAIVVDAVHDRFVDALADVTAGLKVGDPGDRDAWLGPLINPASVDRFRRAVDLSRSDGQVILGGAEPDLPGFFVEPTIVAGVPIGHSLTRDELFVPLVTVTKVRSLSQAMREANAVRFGLTAGIFSAMPEEQQRFLEEIEAGVVFVNRRAGATTGAWPGFQSFCGWKASGSTGKGGLGPWYLQQFLREQSQTLVGVTE